MRFTWAAFPLLVLFLAGCGARPADPAGPGASEPAGDQPRGTFVSGEITVAGKPHALVPGTQVSLDFTDDGRLVANAGCNTMSGQVGNDGGTLRTDGLAMTEMGCDPPRHAQDTWLAGVLDESPRWRLEGTTLTISTPDATLVLDKNPAETATLTGTEWTVESLLDGQTAASTPAGATATLTFDEARVAIDAGCNGGAAGYRTSGDTIRFDPANMTLKACEPDIMRLEAAVLAVVRDEVTFELDGDRLTLTHPSGKGLQLRAH